MTRNELPQTRSLKDKNWYWIDKAIIQEYAKQIGAVGIAVYNYLASLADTNQTCFPSQKHIAEVLGYSRTTVCITIKKLEKHGLIAVDKRSRYYCVYRLLKVRCKAHKTQMLGTLNSDVKHANTNNTIVTRLNNDTGAENVEVAANGKLPHKDFIPKTKEELLALDLAEDLNDHRNLSTYLTYSRKYPESLLRRALGEAKEVPTNRIKKSRAALFNHIIKSYEKEPHHNPGN